MSILLENGFSSIISDKGGVQNKVLTEHLLSEILNNTIDVWGGPSASLILPDNCRGVMYNKNTKIYFLEYPPQFHIIKLDRTLDRFNFEMFNRFKEVYPNDAPKNKKKSFSLLFPYVIFVIVTNGESHDTFMYLKNTPLSSFNDSVYICPLPNTYEDGKICMIINREAEASNDLNRICSLLVSDYWSTEYNDDLNIRLRNRYKDIYNNYYLWEYKSLKNPEEVLSSNFGRTKLLDFSNPVRKPNINQEHVDAMLGTLTNNHRFSDSFDLQYLNYYRNGIVKNIEISCNKFRQSVTLGIMDELYLNGTIYIITNFKNKSARNSLESSCEVEVEVVEKDNPSNKKTFKLEYLQNSRRHSESIVKYALEKNKTIQNDVLINGVNFSRYDSIIAINKYNNKISFFELDYIGIDIENVYFLRDHLANGFFPESTYDFYLRKNLSLDKIIIDGILVEKNKTYKMFSCASNEIIFSYNSEFSFTENIDYINMLGTNSRFTFNGLCCLMKNINNNILNADIRCLTVRSEYKILVTEEEIENSIPINVMSNEQHCKYCEDIYAIKKPSSWLIKKEGSKNEISTSVTFYFEPLKIVRNLEVGNLVIFPTYINGGISTEYYTIKEILKYDSAISIKIQSTLDKEKEKILPLFDPNNGNQYPSILRRVEYKFEDIKKGDYIRKIAKERVCRFNKENVYQISAIIVDSYHPDVLLLLENGQSLWYDDFKKYFEIVIPDETIESNPVEFNGTLKYCGISVQDNGETSYTDFEFLYGIPYPFKFNYEDDGIRYIF